MIVVQIEHLSLVGGSSVEDTTRNVMRRIMTNNLAMHLNYGGRGNKLAFGSCLLKKVVIG